LASEQARELRQRGITAAKAGDKDEARRLLQQAIRLEPDSEAAWLWLASVARDAQERLFCLNKILEINPNNETALKAIESLNAPPAPAAPVVQPLVKRLPNAPDTRPKTSTQEVMRAQQSQTPGVPLPPADRVAEAQKAVDPIIRESLAPIPTTIKWVHKTTRRAGERDIIIYRMYVAAAITGVLIVLLFISAYAVTTNDQLRGVVFGPSQTPSQTPTPSFTPTFGLTPTPSTTPRVTWTPSPQPPNSLPTSNPYALPRVTAVYPPILERPLLDAALALDRGQVSAALPTLQAERERTFDARFEANPYYYEALARVAQGRYNDALEILEEAEGRLEERSDDPSIPALIDAGYAQVYWALARQALDAGNPAGAQEPLAEMEARAEAAIQRDFRIVAPYLVLAEAYARQGRRGDALEVLNRALNRDELDSNTVLIMAKAQLLYEQGDREQALYQAFLARYVDPTTEGAYRLQIQISMERGQYGQAVLYCQDYLYYFPGKTEAYRLLGEARIAEDNPDLALEAFRRGLSGRTTDADTVAMLRLRAGIYMERRQYALAAEDYSAAVAITGEAEDQIGYMQAAYYNGQLAEARATAETLAAGGSSTNPLVNLILGRVLVDLAGDNDNTSLNRAVTYLTQALNTLPAAQSAQRGATYEYLARANLLLGNTDDALDAINNALAIGDSGSRRYLRAQIYEDDNQRDEAIADYEWIMAWSQIYPFPFRVEVEDRLAELRG